MPKVGNTKLTGVGEGVGASAPPKRNRGKYFSGKCHVKFRHFANFHTYIFGQKCLAPKLTELLRLTKNS